MSAYNVKRAVGNLHKASDEAFDALNALKSGDIERGDAVARSGLIGRVIGAENSEVKVRLAAPKIATYEAKMKTKPKGKSEK